jgi:hypothetical protein
MNQRERLDLAELSGDIAAQQQPMVDNPHRLRRARTQLLLSARGRTLGQKPLRRSLIGLLWAPIALAVAVAGVLLVWRTSETALTFQIASGVSGRVGKSLQAPAAAPMTLRFSDGTALSLSPGSRARVAEISAQGAFVVLEDGSLQATVIHRAKSRWLVHAGPYRVLVTGTRFNLRWDEKQGVFDLDLHEGAVTVFGPSLGTGGKALLPKEKLHLGPQRSALDSSTPESAASKTISPAGEQSAAAPSLSTPAPVAPRSSWKALALAGDYASAFAAAEKEGFGSICRQSTSGDLLLLGNTARLAKNNARAQEAFLAARARPGAAHQRAVAAFQLGRLAQDTRGDLAGAAAWFETYLSESPAGPLAREAAGRVMEAQHRAGNVSAARLAARRYVDRYPGGPYESLARRLLGP